MQFHIVKAGYWPEANHTLCGLPWPAHQAIYSSNDTLVFKAHEADELCADCWTDWQPQNAGAVAAKQAALDADSAKAHMPDGHAIERGYLICPVEPQSSRHRGHHEFECACGVHKVSDKSASDNPDGKPFIRRSWTHDEVKAHRAAMRERAMAQRAAAGFGVPAWARGRK